MATFGAFGFSLLCSGKGQNFYTLGYGQGATQAADYSRAVLMGLGQDNKKRYYLQHITLMRETLLGRKGDIDALDWLVIAKNYAKNGDDETAFQAYYMAHLLDHERIGTNSGLPFETSSGASATTSNS